MKLVEDGPKMTLVIIRLTSETLTFSIAGVYFQLIFVDFSEKTLVIAGHPSFF